MRDCVSGEVVLELEYDVAEAERLDRVGLKAVAMERILMDVERRGWKEPEKRLLRVDIVMEADVGLESSKWLMSWRCCLKQCRSSIRGVVQER